MNKGIFAIFFVVAVLSISFPVNAQKTAQRVGGGYTSEGIYYEVYVAEDLAENLSYNSKLDLSDRLCQQGNAGHLCRKL